MKKNLLFILCLALSSLAFGQKQNQKEHNEVRIEIVKLDENGQKVKEVTIMEGEEATNFDHKKYMESLDKDKILEIDIIANTSKDDENVEIEEEISISTPKRRSHVEKRIEKKIIRSSEDHDVDLDEHGIEIKDGKVFLDGKEVEDGEYIDDEGMKTRHVIVIKEGDKDNHGDHKKVWIDKESDKEINLEKGKKMVFISKDEDSSITDAKSKVGLGITIENVEDVKGAKILSVIEGTPAELAGLKKGDIITMINKESVSDIESLVNILSNYEENSVVEVSYFRAGSINKVNSTLKSIDVTNDLHEKHSEDREVIIIKKKN